jgi:hypothetical protein
MRTMTRRNLLTVVAGLSIVAGFALTAPVFLSKEIGLFSSWQPASLEKLAQIGNYLAGTSGVFWALAGLIFVYLSFTNQATEFANQRKEFSENIRQIYISRLTEMVTTSVDRIVRQVERLVLLDQTGYIRKELRLEGYEGLFLTKAVVGAKVEEFMGHGSDTRNKEINPVIDFLSFILENLMPLTALFNNLRDCCNSLLVALPTKALELSLLNQIKDSFFLGIGTDVVDIADYISGSCNVYEDYLVKSKTEVRLFDPIIGIKRTIDIILQFKDLTFDASNISHYLENMHLYQMNHESASQTRRRAEGK